MKVYNKPYLLCCECPFESTSSKIMDSGRNTFNIMKIKASFEWAHNTLLKEAHCDHINGQKRRSILGLLVGIRGKMIQSRCTENIDKTLIGFQSEQDEDSQNCLDSMEQNLSFIPLNKDQSPTLSTSSSDTSSYSSSSTTSSSSICSEFNDDENMNDVEGDKSYFEPTEFQQKHLFNTNLSKTMPIKKKNINQNEEELDDNVIVFSFDKDFDVEHNPYLNDNIFFGNNKKRNFRTMNKDKNEMFKTPKLKKRKTTSIISLHNNHNKKMELDLDGHKISRSFSMPDLRKSTPCIFYKKGGCKKGESCPFQHGENDIKGMDDKDIKFMIDSSLDDHKLLNQICWNFASGHCHRGKKCRWLHSKNTQKT